MNCRNHREKSRQHNTAFCILRTLRAAIWGGWRSRRGEVANRYDRPPRTARGALWTVGEVHFLTSALGKLYPALYRVSRSFGKWLGGYQCVYSSADRDNGYSYYLEGSVKNQVTPIFALQSGMDALGNERYFVGARDNDAVLDTVCKTLRLRGLSVDAG